MEEIVNRVKDSGLISIDLADFKTKTDLVGIDISENLWQGLVIKEKDFRAWIKHNDWTRFQGKAVYIYCSADAIIPTWAYMLIASQLEGIAKNYLVGSLVDMEKKLIREAIQQMNIEQYKDGRIIIKGCSDISCPDFAMVEIIHILQPHVKSIMYGEPCSTVPVFKRK